MNFEKLFLQISNNKAFDFSSFLKDMEIYFQENGFRNEESNNILIVRLDAIGDFVLTSSLIREVRNTYPTANITLVVSPVAYDLAEYCPYVNNIYIQYDDIRYSSTETLLNILPFCKNKLWDKKFDKAFLPQCGGDNFAPNLLGFLSGAKDRYGYDLNINSISPDYKAVDATINHSFKHIPLHEAEKHLQIIDHPVDNIQLEVWFSKEDCIAKNDLIFSLSASKNICKYPIEKWINIFKQLNLKDFAVIGGLTEVDDAAKLEEQIPIKNYVNKLTLRQSAGLISSCKYLIGHDSGMVHIAAALDKPILLISREAKNCQSQSPALLSSIVRFRPYYGKHEDKCIIIQPDYPVDDCFLDPYAVHGVCRGVKNEYFRANIPQKIAIEKGIDTVSQYLNKPHCISTIAEDAIINGYKELISKY